MRQNTALRSRPASQLNILLICILWLFTAALTGCSSAVSGADKPETVQVVIEDNDLIMSVCPAADESGSLPSGAGAPHVNGQMNAQVSSQTDALAVQQTVSQIDAQADQQAVSDNRIFSVPVADDLSFVITAAANCTVTGTDYRDCTLTPLDQTGAGSQPNALKDGNSEHAHRREYLCTLHDVRYDTVVSILAQENPYRIRYEANGGALLAGASPEQLLASGSAAATVSSDGNSCTFVYGTGHLRVNTEQGTDLFLRDGYTLTGWNTAADGSGTHIGLGCRAAVEKDIPLTLYAEWAGWNDADDFTWEKNGSLVTITGYRGAGLPGTSKQNGSAAPAALPSLVIPGTIEGLPVAEIAEGAFKGLPCDSVILPPSVRRVGVHSFDGSSISQLTFFDSIAEITDYAFEGCSQLRTIRINACVPPVYSGSYYDTFPDKCDRLMALYEAPYEDKAAAGHGSGHGSSTADSRGDLAGEGPGRRHTLVLFSGSSARFGYDSACLDDAFPDLNVVNMGVFAYTNALPQLDLIRKFLGDGDILLHSPEFDAAKRQFCTTNAFDDKFFNMIEANYDLLAALDYREYAGVLSAFSTFQKIRRGMKARSYAVSAADYDEDGNPVSTPSYNEYGDYVVYRPDGTDDAPIYDLPLTYTADAFPEAVYIDPLNEVYDKFREEGIRVLFTYAPRNEATLSPQSDAGARAALDSYFRAHLHAEVISGIEDSLYPGRFLFGTDNHLSSEGVAIRTERIRRDLARVLR